MCAAVLLIVAGRDAEWDQAAAEPAANEAEHEAEDPAQGALLLVHVCHAGLPAELASDSNRMVWPVVDWELTNLTLNHNHLGTRLRNHDRLSWHHWLSRGSILLASHRLRGVLGLPLVERWLLLGRAMSDTGSVYLL